MDQVESRARRIVDVVSVQNRYNVADRTSDAVSRRIAPILPLRIFYRSIGPEADFVHRSRVARINDLELMSAATTPLEVNVLQASVPLIVIPIHGTFKASVNGITYECKSSAHACLLPAAPWKLETDVVSVLVISINRDRMQRLTQVMLGRPHGADTPFNWDQPRLLALNARGLAFERMFRHVGQMLDSLIEESVLLEKSGIDDMIYRIVAMLLHPNLFTEMPAESVRYDDNPSAPFNVACDYIRDNLEKRIGLTVLEQVSGLSARTLQYAFQHKYGCSPMRWLTLQRLERAHQKLLRADNRTKVTAVATALRFSNLGNFSRLYQEQFGELPSQTLERSRTSRC